MVIVVFLLLWAIARGLYLLKYCWSAMYVLLATFLSSTIFLFPLCVASPGLEHFFWHTVWGNIVATGLEDIGLFLILIFLNKIPSRFKLPFLTSVKTKPERLEYSTFVIYFAIYLIFHSTGMITYISLINGYPHSILFLVIQIIMGFTTIVVHYRIVKKFETDISNLSAEKERLAAEKARLADETARLAAEKERLETEKAEVEAEKAELETDKAELEAQVGQLNRQLQAKTIDPGFAAEKIEEFLKVLKSAKDTARQPKLFRFSVRQGGQVQFHLTNRERAALPLIASGKSDKEIAQALNIEVSWARQLVKRILAKTKFANRTQLAAFAIIHGLVDAEQIIIEPQPDNRPALDDGANGEDWPPAPAN